MAEAKELTDQQKDDLEMMRGAFGLCVGQLNTDEMEAFNRLCETGLARRCYAGMMGLMGLATAEKNAA